MFFCDLVKVNCVLRQLRGSVAPKRPFQRIIACALVAAVICEESVSCEFRVDVARGMSAFRAAWSELGCFSVRETYKPRLGRTLLLCFCFRLRSQSPFSDSIVGTC